MRGTERWDGGKGRIGKGRGWEELEERERESEGVKGAVSAFCGVSQISKSFVWIDLLLDEDYSDMHKNAKSAILAEL